jgi:hypothetical protein
VSVAAGWESSGGIAVLRRRRHQRQNPTKAASSTTTGTAMPTLIARVWLGFGRGLLVGEEVAVGSVTPVDLGILAALAGISTILLVVEFRLACAIPMRLFVMSKTTYADRRKKSPKK